MTDESFSTRSPSRRAGIFPSGLRSRQPAGGANGFTCSWPYSRPFSASITRTLRTNGETLPPSRTSDMRGSSLSLGAARRLHAIPSPNHWVSAARTCWIRGPSPSGAHEPVDLWIAQRAFTKRLGATFGQQSLAHHKHTVQHDLGDPGASA